MIIPRRLILFPTLASRNYPLADFNSYRGKYCDMTALSPELTVLGIIYAFFGGLVGAIFVAVLFQEKSVMLIRNTRFDLKSAILGICVLVVLSMLVTIFNGLFTQSETEYFLYYIGLFNLDHWPVIFVFQ